mmetsp:Transcript_16080/g.46514  ORF Transcript_16080/g.46514 Transcript_16080/m.46514 type:complete len:251 (-) Transcript_16080:250-1002(-)
MKAEGAGDAVQASAEVILHATLCIVQARVGLREVADVVVNLVRNTLEPRQQLLAGRPGRFGIQRGHVEAHDLVGLLERIHAVLERAAGRPHGLPNLQVAILGLLDLRVDDLFHLRLVLGLLGAQQFPHVLKVVPHRLSMLLLLGEVLLAVLPLLLDLRIDALVGGLLKVVLLLFQVGHPLLEHVDADPCASRRRAPASSSFRPLARNGRRHPGLLQGALLLLLFFLEVINPLLYRLELLERALDHIDLLA